MADAFVLPSHGENFGLVVAEAMACSTPVIISDRVNLYHAVLDHGAGLVAPHDLDSTIAALRQFAALSQKEHADMSRNALDCYRANYDINAAARRVLHSMARHINLDSETEHRSTAHVAEPA
jgi:glycosyltransferase involved in cell wall biosynthesis